MFGKYLAIKYVTLREQLMKFPKCISKYYIET